MPNIAAVLKDEISRISRKEAKKLVEPLRKQITAQRRELAALKREKSELQSEVSRVRKVVKKERPQAQVEPDGRRLRFSARGLQTLRSKLGLSAEDFGKLIEVSGQTIYNWEQGRTTPRTKQLEKLAEVRGIGKREAKRRLQGEQADA